MDAGKWRHPAPASASVCVFVCVLAPPSPSSPAASFLREVQLWPFQWVSGPDSKGFASGRSQPNLLAQAHPYSHSHWQRARTILSAGAPRFSRIPGTLRRFSKSPRQGNKEEDFSNHFPEIFSLISLQTTSPSTVAAKVQARSEDWAGLAGPLSGP